MQNDIPMLFKGPLVRALLNGTKTMTRRVVKPRKDTQLGCELAPHELAGEINGGNYENSPYRPGGRIWVKETHRKIIGQTGGWIETDYRATYDHGYRLGDLIGCSGKWTPSIHMSRDASRINLEIAAVRVEKLQQICVEDVYAEGTCEWAAGETDKWPNPVRSFQALWESNYGPGSWERNPWVYAISFARVTRALEES